MELKVCSQHTQLMVDVENVVTSGVYLHGELELKVGYDLINTINSKDIGVSVKTIRNGKLVNHLYINGIIPILVYGVDGEPYDLIPNCIGYFWTINNNPLIHDGIAYAQWEQRGLICLGSDTDANEYALQQLRNKSQYL